MVHNDKHNAATLVSDFISNLLFILFGIQNLTWVVHKTIWIHGHTTHTFVSTFSALEEGSDCPQSVPTNDSVSSTRSPISAGPSICQNKSSISNSSNNLLSGSCRGSTADYVGSNWQADGVNAVVVLLLLLLRGVDCICSVCVGARVCVCIDNNTTQVLCTNNHSHSCNQKQQQTLMMMIMMLLQPSINHQHV